MQREGLLDVAFVGQDAGDVAEGDGAGSPVAERLERCLRRLKLWQGVVRVALLDQPRTVAPAKLRTRGPLGVRQRRVVFDQGRRPGVDTPQTIGIADVVEQFRRGPQQAHRRFPSPGFQRTQHVGGGRGGGAVVERGFQATDGILGGRGQHVTVAAL